jgi:Tol biopolymer transport system component
MYPVWDQEGQYIVLQDVNSGEILTRIGDYDRFKPQWSLDGDFFVIAFHTRITGALFYASDLFIGNREGILKRLTYFSEEYPEVSLDDNYQISPDGRYMVFSFSVRDEYTDDDGIVIYDLKLNELIKTCFFGSPSNSFHWSPDSKRFVTQRRSGDETFVTIFDIQQKQVYDVVSGKYTSFGWMK